MQRWMPIPEGWMQPIQYPGDNYVNTRAPRNQGAPNLQEAHRRQAQYNADDWAKRHRLPDDEPKSVEVETHKRRRPAK